MTKDTYNYLLATYGRRPGFWIGIVAEVLRTLLLVVVGGWLVSVMVRHLIDGNIDATIQDVWWWVASGAAALTISFLGELASLQAEGKAYNSLQLGFYKKLAGKDMSFYRDNQTGYLVSIYRQHCDGIMELSRFVRSDIARAVTALVAPVVVLWWFDWRVGLIGLGLVIVQILYVVWASAKVNPYRHITHEIYRKLSGEVADQITNMVAFKASGREAAGLQRIEELAAQENEAFWKRRSLSTLLDLPRMLITVFGMGAVLLVMLYGAKKGAVDISLFVLVFIYLFRILQEVYGFPERIMRHDDLITKTAPTLAYLEASHEAITDPEKPEKLTVTKGTLELRDVCFSYKNKANQENTKVFDKLTINIGAKEHIGIVGLSGAGKSTLAGLIMRFDEVDAGQILIDDTDIRTVRQSDLRQHIAYVPQEPLLFHKTIKENIAYFDDSAPNDAIERAAKAAHAHEFISKLSDGYDTVVGERGVKLSGGQKQRIAIARAILKNAPIVLLDEATSALDSESERIIQSSLPEVLGEHTAIVIAHRLSTIAGMDRIIVMQDGAVIEQGSHDELLRLNGRYKELWDKQVKFYG